MEFLLEITTTHGHKILINEDQVTAIKPFPRTQDLGTGGEGAVIEMSSGKSYDCASPTFAEWRNDYLKRSN